MALWNGRRGYDGNGDDGYGLSASHADAHGFRVQATRAYSVPGTPDDRRCHGNGSWDRRVTERGW
jgi:hypothetical protein